MKPLSADPAKLAEAEHFRQEAYGAFVESRDFVLRGVPRDPPSRIEWTQEHFKKWKRATDNNEEPAEDMSARMHFGIGGIPGAERWMAKSITMRLDAMGIPPDEWKGPTEATMAEWRRISNQNDPVTAIREFAGFMDRLAVGTQQRAEERRIEMRKRDIAVRSLEHAGYPPSSTTSKSVESLMKLIRSDDVKTWPVDLDGFPSLLLVTKDAQGNPVARGRKNSDGRFRPATISPPFRPWRVDEESDEDPMQMDEDSAD